MSNFSFLKNIDVALYDMANDAEKLYRDEYFEQCITQTRRFGENVCKKMLKNSKYECNTFDEMLNCIKDMSKGEPREKEFIEDLYFLKKTGNDAVHGSFVKKEGMVALECLQRMFEVAINFALSLDGADKRIVALDYDVELLVTGKNKDNKSLAQKYLERATQKEKSEKIIKARDESKNSKFYKKGKTFKANNVKKSDVNSKKTKEKSFIKKTKPKKAKSKSNKNSAFGRNLFWGLVIFSSAVSICAVFYLLYLL